MRFIPYERLLTTHTSESYPGASAVYPVASDCSKLQRSSGCTSLQVPTLVYGQNQEQWWNGAI